MFERLETLPPDPILGLSVAFREDPSPDKVDLSVGVYKDRGGTTPVMAAVRQAEIAVIGGQSTKVYLPPAGVPGFREAIFSLVMGQDAPALRSRAGVIPSIVGMNVGGLPLVHDRSGFIVTILILIGKSGLAFLILKRLGMLQR